jgi:hypothetical protein
VSTYVVTLKATGQEVYRYSAESPVEWQGMEFATHDHVALPELPAEPSSPPTMYGGRRDLAVLEFMRLLTPTERITIRMAAAQNALIADYLDLMYHAKIVHLDDTDTSNALHMMEQGGILGAGRAAEILNG